MTKNPIIYIEHILECIELIQRYLKKTTKSDFFHNCERRDSVVRRLEIIGEAARAIPSLLKNKYPQVEWRAMADFRNVLIHEYEDLNFDIIWNIATKEIAPLKKQMRQIKKDLEKD